MTLKTKALVKDLELQLDYLVGYANQGLHWKREYHFRRTLIDNVLCDENTPPEIVEKINNVQEAIFRLKAQDTGGQPYLNFKEEEREAKHKVKVNDYLLSEPYYIEI